MHDGSRARLLVTPAAMADMYRAGATVRVVAIAAGCAVSTAYKYLMRERVTMRPRGTPRLGR